MCDYSLYGVAARSARIGDKLVTTHFWNTTTQGFSAVDQPTVAVCLLPGTEVAFENKVERISLDFSFCSEGASRCLTGSHVSGR